MIRRPPISTLFPYTPLYRSPPAPELPDPRRHLHRRLAAAVGPRGDAQGRARPGPPDAARRDDGRAGVRQAVDPDPGVVPGRGLRARRPDRRDVARDVADRARRADLG